MFFVCFPEIVFYYDILMNTMIDVDGVTLPNACIDEMDMIGVGRILDAVPHSPHSDFDLFRVSMIDIDDVTLYDVCTDEMDMIGTSHILDAAPHEPRSALDMFGAFMLEIDDDDSVTVVTPDVSLLRERLILWTHLFLLTLCPGLSPALMMWLVEIIMI